VEQIPEEEEGVEDGGAVEETTANENKKKDGEDWFNIRSRLSWLDITNNNNASSQYQSPELWTKDGSDGVLDADILSKRIPKSRLKDILPGQSREAREDKEDSSFNDTCGCGSFFTST